VGGGPDRHRWPLSGSGESLYWQGLNKGKKSVAINLATPRGRELALELIAAPGDTAGLFLTNYPATSFLSHANLAQRRADLITLRVQGWADGSSGLDYTVNAVTGLPMMTGPVDARGPVNHVLPAWDLSTGALAAFHLMAAERHRRLTGQGGEILLPLSSVAFSALGALGQIAEVQLSGADRPRVGNNLFGAFGRDFKTADGAYLIVVAITRKQWSGLLKALGLVEQVATLQSQLGVNFDHDEGARFEHRASLDPLVAWAIAARPLAELRIVFDEHEVCWAPYRTLSEALALEAELSEANPMMSQVTHPGALTYLTPGSPARYASLERVSPERAPALGEHTAAVLSEILRFADHEIGMLLEQGVIAQAED
jgi:2-methylfumaryl-CoA isomerase